MPRICFGRCSTASCGGRAPWKTAGRAVYFCKHILIREDGRHSSVIEEICNCKDPRLMCHPVVAYVVDLVWAKIARHTFFARNAALMMTLVLYTLSQAVLDIGTQKGVYEDEGAGTRFAVALCRAFIYFVFLGSHMVTHIKLALYGNRAESNENSEALGGVKVPSILSKHAPCYTLALVLFAMLARDPIVNCLGKSPFLTQHCVEGEIVSPSYEVLSMLGALNLYVLASDYCVFSIRIAAFAFMFNKVMSEVMLFLFGFAVLLLAFGTGAAALKADDVHGFENLPNSIASLLDVFLGMAHADDYERIASVPVLKLLVMAFYIVTAVYLVNLLIAQLANTYSSTVEDMVGFARMRRGVKVVEEMDLTSRNRWDGFVRSLRMDLPVSFCEGDAGMPGAIEVMERAAPGATNVESIRRYGGTTSFDAVWPEEESVNATDADDRLERMENLMRKMAKKLDKSTAGRKGGGSTAGGGSVMSSWDGGSDASLQSGKSE